MNDIIYRYKAFCEEISSDILADIKGRLKYKDEIHLSKSVIVNTWNRGFYFEVFKISKRPSDDSLLIHGNYNGDGDSYDFLSCVNVDGLVKIYEQIL